MPRHVFLADESRNARRTIADALEILRSKAGLDEDNRAQARIGWLKLPSAETVGVVQVVLGSPGNDTVWVVSLPSSKEFHARRPNSSQRDRFDIAGLDGATIDSAGTVLLTDGATLHAVEIIPAHVPNTPSELDYLIVHRTIAFIPGTEERCYRRLRDSVPAQFEKMVPDLRYTGPNGSCAARTAVRSAYASGVGRAALTPPPRVALGAMPHRFPPHWSIEESSALKDIPSPPNSAQPGRLRGPAPRQF